MTRRESTDQRLVYDNTQAKGSLPVVSGIRFYRTWPYLVTHMLPVAAVALQWGMTKDHVTYKVQNIYCNLALHRKNLTMPGMHRQGTRYQNQCGGGWGATPSQTQVGSKQRACEKEQKVSQQTNQHQKHHKRLRYHRSQETSILRTKWTNSLNPAHWIR